MELAGISSGRGLRVMHILIHPFAIIHAESPVFLRDRPCGNGEQQLGGALHGKERVQG